MRRFLSVLFCVLVAALVMPLGIANRQPVTLTLDPFGRTGTPLAVDVPLSLLLFTLFMLGLLLGGAATWFTQGKWRRTARHKSREAYQWKAEADRLTRDQGDAGTAVPSTAGTRRGGQTAKLGYGR
jgi:uncharacterized integral membrane protein